MLAKINHGNLRMGIATPGDDKDVLQHERLKQNL